MNCEAEADIDDPDFNVGESFLTPKLFCLLEYWTGLKWVVWVCVCVSVPQSNVGWEYVPTVYLSGLSYL